MPKDQADERIREFQAGFRWLRSPGIVSIAAVQGHSIGAGAQLALACDLRVFTEDRRARAARGDTAWALRPTGTSNSWSSWGTSRGARDVPDGAAA